MTNCPKCGTLLNDGVNVCPNCGTVIAPFAAPQPNMDPNQQYQAPQQPQQPYQYQYAQPIPDPKDHTSEFEANDISDNKVISMCAYLLGLVGIFIALLAAPQSPYAAFHVRQSLKMTIVETLLMICAAVLAFTIIVPIAAVICLGIVFVLRVIMFFNVAGGKAKECPIISGLGFLK